MWKRYKDQRWVPSWSPLSWTSQEARWWGKGSAWFFCLVWSVDHALRPSWDPGSSLAVPRSWPFLIGSPPLIYLTFLPNCKRSLKTICYTAPLIFIWLSFTRILTCRTLNCVFTFKSCLSKNKNILIGTTSFDWIIFHY